MENKTIFRPFPPNKPELFKLKKYFWTDLICVDSWIIVIIGFFYWIYFLGAFDSLEIYYVAIGITILIRLWPFVVTNNQKRFKNKKMMVSYHEEVKKHEKSLREYYTLKTRIEAEREKSKKIEQQRIGEAERQKKMGLNGHSSLKSTSEKKIDIESKNIKTNNQRSTVMKTFEELTKEEREQIRERIRGQRASSIADPSLIQPKDYHLEVEVNNTIRNYSGICAVLAIQPIPFADIFILTPTQILMGKKIASLRGYIIKENSIESILKEISGIIGMGIIAQQLVIGAYKTVLPFFGGFTTIPVVYGLTYGIGQVMDYYILAKINGMSINKSDIEKIFKSSREIGQREGKSKEKEIQARAKK
jgi:uncharacterized protein (DUF697 family)